MTSKAVDTKQPLQHDIPGQFIYFEKSEIASFIPKINEKIQRLMCIEDIKIQSVAIIGYN